MAEMTVEQKEIQEGKKDLTVFWLRMLGYVMAGVVAPISAFALKFGIFDVTSYGVTTDDLGNVTHVHIALNGWGIVSCILVGFFAISVLKEIVEAHSGYSLTKQCLTGVVKKIVPLAIGVAICYFLKGVIEQVTFCLTVLAISQIAAIPLNPLPKWKYEKRGEEDYSALAESLVKAISRRSRKGDK
jgi:hypothetical protein